MANFLNEVEFILHENATFVSAADLKSPMAGNVAAVLTQSEAEILSTEKNGEIIEIANAFK